MQQIADEDFHFLGMGTFPSVCRLRAFADEEQPTIVIATELPHNPGTSVTHAAEVLATQVWNWLERPPAGMVFIEHYEQDGPEQYARERFALVSFSELDGQFIRPTWRHIEKEDVERLISQTL